MVVVLCFWFYGCGSSFLVLWFWWSSGLQLFSLQSRFASHCCCSRKASVLSGWTASEILGYLIYSEPSLSKYPKYKIKPSFFPHCYNVISVFCSFSYWPVFYNRLISNRSFSFISFLLNLFITDFSPLLCINGELLSLQAWVNPGVMWAAALWMASARN